MGHRWVIARRDKTGHVGMEGRDPLLWRDKKKRHIGWGSVRLSGEEKNTWSGTERDPISNCRAFFQTGAVSLVGTPGDKGSQPWVW